MNELFCELDIHYFLWIFILPCFSELIEMS